MSPILLMQERIGLDRIKKNGSGCRVAKALNE